MNIWQLLWLECRHPYLSRPMQGERACTECGARFEFHSYDIAPDERGRMAHYEVHDRAISRLHPRQLLRFKRKEQSK